MCLPRISMHFLTRRPKCSMTRRHWSCGMSCTASTIAAFSSSKFWRSLPQSLSFKNPHKWKSRGLKSFFLLYWKVQLRATLHGFLMKLHNLVDVTIFIKISNFFSDIVLKLLHNFSAWIVYTPVNFFFYLTKNCRFYQIFRGFVFFLVTWYNTPKVKMI